MVPQERIRQLARFGLPELWTPYSVSLEHYFFGSVMCDLTNLVFTVSLLLSRPSGEPSFALVIEDDATGEKRQVVEIGSQLRVIHVDCNVTGTSYNYRL